MPGRAGPRALPLAAGGPRPARQVVSPRRAIGPRPRGPPGIGPGGGPASPLLAAGATAPAPGPSDPPIGRRLGRPCSDSPPAGPDAVLRGSAPQPAAPPPRLARRRSSAELAGPVLPDPAPSAPFRVPPPAPPDAGPLGAPYHGPSVLGAALTAAGAARHAQQDWPQDGRELRPRPAEGALQRVSPGARRPPCGAGAGATRPAQVVGGRVAAAAGGRQPGAPGRGAGGKERRGPFGPRGVPGGPDAPAPRGGRDEVFLGSDLRGGLRGAGAGAGGGRRRALHGPGQC